uniref:Fungal lipase-type domain-containing protein n=1 Tax=Helicotheca tamesis TaxID=374047 RepID=A0A7S2IAN3_9STRA|mmetsp:Transcript_7293/g.9925  ORF Transcript_7293/g.9925 Transcript_7293/m.9925 type:complete len:436 (+) Transcript_7293:139-1446(+)|eukprot:CAMPEP_0185734992 /NCGR_PEP_ID=MMETSP1171-20130828/24076_1 /TAXON_ID=374046 /ORGANISM="Helicotheca tamensis, Strain CCMP826" /LENGTH=435 /DNA_ID=CAMNT_0028405151 /DNA_START=36 /DNA_END=1343 /DNA_ORIENTATION=-
MSKKSFQLAVLLFLTALIVPFPSGVYAKDESPKDSPPTLRRKYGRPELIEPKYDDDGSDGSVNLYRNIKDMVVLSSYIYQHAALIEDIHETSQWYKFWDSRDAENDEKLRTDLSDAKSVGDILDVSEKNMQIMEKNNRRVRDATKVIKNDMADAHATDATKDSEILVIHADKEDVKKSCVYAIIVNHNLKRLAVVFRGTSNIGDWSRDVLVMQKKYDNPVKSQTDVPKIKIHSGFAEAILKDGKIDKIVDEVNGYMKDLKGYRLFVTGHSLGGALSTLFGFYAAANDDLMEHVYGPVSLFSVASPRVGNAKFLEAHKHLEHMGRLRHARVHNESDKVSRVPYLGTGYYKHVGLEVRLRSIKRNLGPILDYPAYAQWTQAGGTLKESVVALVDALRLHGTELTRKRLKFSKELLEDTTLEREYRRLWGLEYATTFS